MDKQEALRYKKLIENNYGFVVSLYNVYDKKTMIMKKDEYGICVEMTPRYLRSEDQCNEFIRKLNDM